ncbi:MAG TPA: hypothetical protein EYO33_31895 [Phycisphaerales bacterium]|nr:hypothetical protein [Phycisphaerales bacterium]
MNTYLKTGLALFLAICLLLTVLPHLTGTRARDKFNGCRENFKELGVAIEMYSTDWNGNCPPNLEFLTPKYLKEIHECPRACRVTYKATFGANAPLNNDNYESYLIECIGTNHAEHGIPTDYPKYNALDGFIDNKKLKKTLKQG